MKKIIILVLLLLIPIKVDAVEFDLYSKNVYLYDYKTNSVVYEKNSTNRALVASLTKIMTSIIAIENIDDINEKEVINKDILKYVSSDLAIVGFKENEEVTYKDLLYGSLLKSGADATHSLAVFLTGSEENFVDKMNEKSKYLKLDNTHFSNTIGIEPSTNDHYSTAKDFSKILLYALKDKTFKEIFTSNKYLTSDKKIEIKTSKKAVENKYNIDLSCIKGYKTGYTSKSGLSMASFNETNNSSLILITLNASKDDSPIAHFLDAKKLYDYYNKNYKYYYLGKKGDNIGNVNTVYDEKINIKLDKDITLYLKKFNSKKIKRMLTINKKLDSKIKKGDIIGNYKIYNGKKLIYKTNIKISKNIIFKLKPVYKTIIGFLFIILVIGFYIKRKKRLKKR